MDMFLSKNYRSVELSICPYNHNGEFALTVSIKDVNGYIIDNINHKTFKSYVKAMEYATEWVKTTMSIYKEN